jgi:hypothetical protein
METNPVYFSSVVATAARAVCSDAPAFAVSKAKKQPHV